MIKEYLNKNDCEVVICEFSDIRHILKDFHYKKDSIGGGIHRCFALLINEKLVGGSITGKPRHSDKYPNAIDIRRMALIDETPKNSESFFISQIIKYYSSNSKIGFILSYSDLTAGHIGTIYKASNFKFIGETSPTKNVIWNGKTYHPRSLSIDRDYSYKLRDAVKNGTAVIEEGKPKKIWVFEIRNKNRYKKTNFKHLNNRTLFLF